jgi:predicted phosphodiesterase
VKKALDSQDKHEIVADLKRLTSILGRAPTREEYHRQGLGSFSERTIQRVFGGFSPAIIAAGLQKTISYEDKRKVKFKYRPALLQGFTIHKLNLKELFKRAGNPPSLKILAQPDTHGKYRDERAFNCMLKFSKYWKPDVWLIMGDFVDAEGISHWPADDTEPRRLVPEILECRELLKRINDASPSVTTRIYLTGNHEDWIRQACAQMPQMFDGLEQLGIEVDLKSMLDLERFGWDLFPINDVVRIGKMNWTHGYYTGDGHPKKHLIKLKGSIHYGHTHDKLAYNDCSMDGPLESQSLGCLCRLDAKFLRGKPNNWVHSKGLYEMFPDGTYTFMLPNIVNGRMSYNGKVFEG